MTNNIIAIILVALMTACGGTASNNSCPHRTHQVTDAAGRVSVVDNTPAEDQQVCDYLVYLSAHVHDGVVDCDARQGVTGGQCVDAGTTSIGSECGAVETGLYDASTYGVYDSAETECEKAGGECRPETNIANSRVFCVAL